MRRIKLIDLINMTDEQKLQWLSQFTDDEQAVIVNHIRDLKHESDNIRRAEYDDVNHTVLMAEVLNTEIGIA